MEQIKRILTTIIFIPFLVYIIYLDSILPFTILVILVCALALKEFYNLGLKSNLVLLQNFGIFVGLVGCTIFIFGHELCSIISIFSVIFLFFIYFLLNPKKRENLLEKMSLGIFSAIYVGWLLGHILWIRTYFEAELAAKILFLLFFVVWGQDAASLYIGLTLGKRKLAPTISPKKSIEGALAGLLAGLILAVIAKFWFFKSLGLSWAIFLGIFMSFFGQLGDLFESILKRSAGVKDSSSLIPGHGGFLDRIDSLLFNGIFLFCFFKVYFS